MHQWVEAAKKFFAGLLFHFLVMKAQLRYILQEEKMNFRENLVLRSTDCAIVWNFWPSWHLFTDSIAETWNWDWIKKVRRQSRSWSLERIHCSSEKTNSFVVPIRKPCSWKKTFEHRGNHFMLSEVFNPNLRRNHHFYKNPFYVDSSCKIFKSKCNVYQNEPQLSVQQ